MVKKREPVLIANGQGFWGDSILGPIRLTTEGQLHYLTLDYLAEVTMSIMQKLKRRNPEAGYATDFIKLLDRILPTVIDNNIKIIASAGGANPGACRRAVGDVIIKHGLRNVNVAIIKGDDILDKIDDYINRGETFINMDSGEPISNVAEKITSANVYLGAFCVAEALEKGADIVITGRVTDPSLVLGPMIYEFGWDESDFDKLAAGTVSGHIVECGAQCTGANYTNWREINDFINIGYPVIEAHADGISYITKHKNTGGDVNIKTVKSQLVYEMGNPVHYITPDVIADFTSIRLEQSGKNRVKVYNIKGEQPTDTLKVSLSYLSGYKAIGQLTIAGPDALEKAKLSAEIIWGRLKYDGIEFPEEDKIVEFLGADTCHKGILSSQNVSEVVLRIGVRGHDKEKVNRFGMEIVPLVTSGPPGVTGFGGGRPKATEIISYWPALVSKDKIQTDIDVEKMG